jgi:hypothetical protein
MGAANLPLAGDVLPRLPFQRYGQGPGGVATRALSHTGPVGERANCVQRSGLPAG